MTIEHSTIFIDHLRLHAHHGVMPQERTVGADFDICLRVHYNITRACTSDDVSHTLNYAELLQTVKEQMNIPSALLEHVAARIGEAVFTRFTEAKAIELKLTKLNPPMGADCDGAGVELFLKNES